MYSNPPTSSSGKWSFRFLRIMRKAGSKEKNYLLLGLIGLMVIGFFVYGILVFGSVNSAIRYSPADIVYGEEFQAIHNMGPGNYVSLSEPTVVSQSINPEIRLSEAFYDFGEVGSSQVVTRTFVIANLGQTPLVILRAYTTCGCTTAEFTASEIPPGKVVLMTLRFDAGYHAMGGSTVRRGVMIETNDPDHPIQEIWIQASVKGNSN